MSRQDTYNSSVWRNLNRPFVVTFLGGLIVAILTFTSQLFADHLSFHRELRVAKCTVQRDVFADYSEGAYTAVGSIYDYKRFHHLKHGDDPVTKAVRKQKLDQGFDITGAFRQVKSEHRSSPSLKSLAVQAEVHFEDEAVRNAARAITPAVDAVYDAETFREIESRRKALNDLVRELQFAMAKELRRHQSDESSICNVRLRPQR